MTLVVARKKNSILAIVADTPLTKHDKALPHHEGCLKTCLLPGSLSVSFSNSPELAGRAFKEFRTRYPDGANFKEAVAFFEASSKNTENEYILAFMPQAKLVKISDGRRIETQANTVWIGDKAAYERFREYETRSRPQDLHGRAVPVALFTDEMTGSPASDLYSTMRNVILDRDITSVGGFAYTVSSRVDGFRPSVYSDMLFNWPMDVGPDFEFDMNAPLDLGASDENSNFSISQISPSYLQNNISGFYLMPARKLYLFVGAENLLADKCFVANLEPRFIKTYLDMSFKMDMDWLVFVASADPARSETKPGPRPESGPTGVGFSILCHENTSAKKPS